MLIYFALTALLFLLREADCLSNPLINPTNANFQAGLNTLLSSGSLGTSVQTYQFLLVNAMANNTMRGAIGIVTNEMTMIGQQMGFEVIIVSVDSTQMFVEAHSHSATNPISKMKISYMLTYYVQLSFNYLSKVFSIFFLIFRDVLTDNVMNNTLTDSSFCPYTSSGSVQCRSTTINLPYPAIGNTMKAKAWIAGFAVDSFRNGMGSNSVFGVGLMYQSAQSTSISMSVYIYGRAYLTSVSVYYLSYEQQALNILGDKVIILGSSSIGCSITWGSLCQVWDPLNINTTYTTSNTGFSSYYSTNYFYGFYNYISGYDSTSNYAMNFAVSGTTLSGTAYQTGFSYYGNPDGIFRVSYSYLILLQFYCASTGTDIYYVLGQNMCNSTCNNWISQYADVNRKCQACDPVCYKCSGASYLCDDCYFSQNRILSGDSCICNPIGYYDDGSSLTCPACHYSCRSCTGPSASQCIDCSTTSHRTININSCFCDARYYDNGFNSICASCHYTCLTCSSNTATTCLTCQATDFRSVLSTNNFCPCIVGYYDKGSPNSVCALCHYSCWTCSGTGSSACTSCNSTVEFRTTWGSSCPCSLGYYDNNVQVCAICHVTCKSCNGGTQYDCLSCDNLKFRALQSGQCKCKASYYEFNLTCYNCHYTCYNCTDSTMYNCVNCASATTFRNYNGATGVCYCIDGYTDVGVTQCAKCDRTCLTCQSLITTCITCDPTKNRVLAGNTCPCISGYVQTGLVSGFCPKCHYSCLTCSGTASTQCLSCVTTWRTLSGGSCLCNTHTYDNGIATQCFPCNQECLQCSDQYETTCLSCDPLYLRQIVGTAPKPCTCIQRYFQNNNALLCDTCHYSCLTCSTISTNCTTCDSITDHRFAVGNTCPCMEHYYEVYAQSCATCISTCRNCSVNPNNCTSCYTDRYLLGNICNCNPGTYADLFLVCQTCHYYCKTCDSTSTTCTSCPLYSFRTLNNASCPCDFGNYDNSTTICVKCPYQCNGCTGPDPADCVTCPLSSQRTLQPDKTCPCNVGFYDDGISPTCKACKNICASCTAFSVCTSCYPVSSQFRTLFSTDCKCISGYYDNLISPVCQLCHYSCASCSGGLSTNCITCKTNRAYQSGTTSCPCQNGFYETAQICYACDSSCKTCTGTATNCTGCDLTVRYLLNNKCFCRQGYFDNGGVCSPCDISCGSCNISAINCLSCNSSQFTILSGSSCVCQPGQVQDPVTLVCSSCNIECQTCFASGQTSCLTCRVNTHRTYNSVAYSCDCDPGYFDQGYASCTQCDSSCMTCYGATNLNCSSCYPGANKLGSSCRYPVTCSSGYNYEGICLPSCPNSTFPFVNFCQPCINNCKTCLSGTVCTSCIEGYFFNSTSKTCNVNCPQGGFINWVNSTCDFCPLGCDICVQRNGSLVCPKCSTGYYLFNHTICVNSSFCATPNYVIVGVQCLGCEYPCETCNNVSFNGCISCKQGYSLYFGECLSICPVGYYSYEKVCLQCESRCSKCSSTACELCKEGYYLTPQKNNPKCVSVNYFFNPLTGLQEKCHPNCYSCTNSSFSSCISCQKFRGDQAEMAISGYCDCWDDSIDIGNGQCSFNSFEQVESYTKVLKSSTDSAIYTAAVASVFTGNFISSSLFLLYQQSYSVMFFVNSSAVLQTDQYLKEALSKNINFYLNQQTATNNSKTKYSRLLVTLQNDLSLFSRGNQVDFYLFDWALYTVIVIGSCWLVVIVLDCVIGRKCQRENETVRTVLGAVRSVLQESAMIVLHLLTISQISLYATVTFKFIFENFASLQINWAKFILSIIMCIYYIGYVIRLIIGCCRKDKPEANSKPNQYNGLKILTFYFDLSAIELQNKRKAKFTSKDQNISLDEIPVMKKLYILLLMIRLALSSVLVILFSSNPTLQVVGILSVMLLWTVYSMIWCPYQKLIKIFIHLNELVFLAQIAVILYSVMQPEVSRIGPAYFSLVLNGIQIGSMLIFSVLLVVRVIYGVCQQSKGPNTNRVQNIYFSENENNNSQLYLNENKNDSQIEHEIKQYRLDENIFDPDLVIQQDKKQRRAIKESKDKIKDQLNYRPNNRDQDDKNIQDIKAFYESENMPEPETRIQNEQSKGSEEGENVIIKKKYRAVRKSKN